MSYYPISSELYDTVVPIRGNFRAVRALLSAFGLLATALRYASALMGRIASTSFPLCVKRAPKSASRVSALMTCDILPR